LIGPTRAEVIVTARGQLPASQTLLPKNG